MSADDRDSLDERLARHTKRWFPVAVASLTVVAGVLLGPGFGVLVLAAGAFIGAIAAMWTSVRSLFGEAPLTAEDAFAIGAPSTEEEQKRAVLRAIKDIEFERSVGKISEADYHPLMAEKRAEAKMLLRVIDEQTSPERLRVERLVANHLAAKGLGEAPLAEAAAPEALPAEGPADALPPAPEISWLPQQPAAAKPAASKKKGKKKRAKGPRCPSCNVVNERDAVFCKKCASRLGEART